MNWWGRGGYEWAEKSYAFICKIVSNLFDYWALGIVLWQEAITNKTIGMLQIHFPPVYVQFSVVCTRRDGYSGRITTHF